MGAIKVGDWVQLTSNEGPDDEYHPRLGAIGEVISIDDCGDLFVAWNDKDLPERVREAYDEHIRHKTGLCCRKQFVELYRRQGCQNPTGRISIGQWLKTRKHSDLAKVLSTYVDCDVCSMLMAKYGIQPRCNERAELDGCWRTWDELMKKERIDSDEIME